MALRTYLGIATTGHDLPTVVHASRAFKARDVIFKGRCNHSNILVWDFVIVISARGRTNCYFAQGVSTKSQLTKKYGPDWSRSFNPSRSASSAV